MSNSDVRKQISEKAAIVRTWPVWKQNILAHSAQPTNSSARPPVVSQKQQFEFAER